MQYPVDSLKPLDLADFWDFIRYLFAISRFVASGARTNDSKLILGGLIFGCELVLRYRETYITSPVEIPVSVRICPIATSLEPGFLTIRSAPCLSPESTVVSGVFISVGICWWQDKEVDSIDKFGIVLVGAVFSHQLKEVTLSIKK